MSICACAQRRGRRGRLRGRPPRRPRGHTTTSSRQISREVDTQPSNTSDSDSGAPTAQLTSDVDQRASQVNLHYGLRRNRVPRYRCGTSRFRDCTCVLALNKSRTLPTVPPKFPVSPKTQPLIDNGGLLVCRLMIGVEKTYTELERERIFAVDIIMELISKSKIADLSQHQGVDERCPRIGIHICGHSASYYS